MGVLVNVLGVLVSGGLHKWSGLGVVGVVNNASAILFVSYDIKTMLQRFTEFLQDKLIKFNMFI